MHEKINSPHYIIKLAQEMRKNLTPCEEILWDKLKEKKLNGCKFRRQHPFNRYILDFYCHENKLAIEVDGDVHRDKCDQDEFRDKYLGSVGIKTIRIKNDEILHSIDEVLTKIMTSL
jgi:very-short-patch-repair endonuclease